MSTRPPAPSSSPNPTGQPVPPGPRDPGGRGTSIATSRWLVPAIVVLVVALLIAVVFAMRDGQSSAGEPPPGTEAVTDPNAADPNAPPQAPAGAPTDVEGPASVDLSTVARLDAGDQLGFGAVDAPVTLVVFSDYQCGYCARWSADTFPVVMDYVDAGVVRLEWRDINIFGADSERAARASYAAALQGAFVEYHDGLFPAGQTRSGAQLTDAALIALASDLGLDTEQFAADLAAPETAAEIARNAELGIGLGAYSTPSFILAGQPIVGAQPTEVFVAAIEAAAGTPAG